MHRSIIVRIDWDDEAEVWVASATTSAWRPNPILQDNLREKVLGMIRELLEFKAESYSDLPEIPVYIVAQRLERVSNPRFR